MELMFCLASSTPPRFSSLKLTPMASSTVPFPSLSLLPIVSTSHGKPPATKRGSSITTVSATPTLTTAPLDTSDTSTPVPRKKVLVPIGFGTEEMEAVIIVHVLRRAGAEVTVASVEPRLEIEAASGTRLVADTSISSCATEIFDLVALPGGMPGSARLRDCEVLRQITWKQVEDKRLYGAICASSAVTLLPWGLTKKKQWVNLS